MACYLCAAACPVDCIALQATEDEHGRRYPEFFRINFSRCIFCGFCEEACPTYAIQLTPDFEWASTTGTTWSTKRRICSSAGPGKYPDYNFYRVAGRGDRRQTQGGGRERRAARAICGARCREDRYERRLLHFRALVAVVATAGVITSAANAVHGCST